MTSNPFITVPLYPMRVTEAETRSPDFPMRLADLVLDWANGEGRACHGDDGVHEVIVYINDQVSRLSYYGPWPQTLWVPMEGVTV